MKHDKHLAPFDFYPEANSSTASSSDVDAVDSDVREKDPDDFWFQHWFIFLKKQHDEKLFVKLVPET